MQFLYEQTYPPLLTRIAAFGLAGCLLLAVCDKQVLPQQQSYAVSLEQAQRLAEHCGAYLPGQQPEVGQILNHWVLAANETPDTPALYVFNYEGGGFSIVPADKHLTPLVAYATSGRYEAANRPAGVLKWEEKTAQVVTDAAAVAEAPAPGLLLDLEAGLNPTGQVRHLTTIQAAAGDTTTRLLPQPGPPQDYSVTHGPYVPVAWGQGCSYNTLCPANSNGNDPCGHRWTGCVITAMAQVMARWQYPTSYNWTSMPVSGGASTQLKQLMADGQSNIPSVSYTNTGTEAHLSDAAGVGNFGHTLSPAAGLRYFGYSSADFGSYDYIKVQNDLLVGRPAILDGCTDRAHFLGYAYYNNCHAWVCDGLQNNGYYYPDGNGGYISYFSIFLHMNWGWHESGSYNGVGGGDYDGWYSYANWNIPGKNVNYQYANDEIVNIHP